MPESRAGSISSAATLTIPALRLAGKVGPKLVAKMGRVNPATEKVHRADMFRQMTKDVKSLDGDDMAEVVKWLIGAEFFSGMILPSRRQVMTKAFGKSAMDHLDQFRMLSSLGMPVDNDPRMGIDVMRTSDHPIRRASKRLLERR